MKRTTITSLAFILIGVCSGINAGEPRRWTNTAGKSIEAEYTDHNESRVVLKLQSGAVVEVPLDHLSMSDQQYLAGKTKEIEESKWDGIPEWKERHLKVLALVDELENGSKPDISAKTDQKPLARETMTITALRLAAEDGDAGSMFQLALLHATGEGMPPDMEKAVTLLDQGAQLGHVPSMYLLGLCYLDGDGVTKDDGRAFDWLSQAAEHQDPGALYTLGMIYDSGLAGGLPQDSKVAHSLFKLASTLGSGDATAILAAKSQAWKTEALNSQSEVLEAGRRAEERAAESARRRMRDYEEAMSGRFIP